MKGVAIRYELINEYVTLGIDSKQNEEIKFKDIVQDPSSSDEENFDDVPFLVIHPCSCLVLQ